MSALGVALRPLSWCWRVWYAAGWLRWNLPVSRETALRLAEEQADAVYQILNRQHDAVIRMLLDLVRGDLYDQWDRAGCQPPGPADTPVTQRDVDDAVAELIRLARQEFGRGGAR